VPQALAWMCGLKAWLRNTTRSFSFYMMQSATQVIKEHSRYATELWPCVPWNS
jgi:hypothetical protein